MNKKFKAKALYKETNRKRTVTLTAKSEAEVVQILLQTGYAEPFEITEELPEPASVRQMEYAKALKIDVPANPTKEDLSALISRKVDNDSDSNPELVEFALEKSLSFSAHIGKKALYNLLFNSLPPEDKVAFFAFSVYRWLSEDRRGNLENHPSRDVFYEFAKGQVGNESFIKSLDRYAGEDLRFFGVLKFADGGEAQGGSANTIAYKTCADFIHAKFGTPKTKTATTGSRSAEPSPGKGGCMGVAAILAIICSLLAAFAPLKAQPPRTDQYFLYGILPADGDTSRVSWLFGTMHHFGSEYVFAHQQLLLLAKGSDAIVTEVDRETLLAGPAANRPDDLRSPTPLDQLLTREDYQFVRQQVSEYLNSDIEPFRELYPSVLLEYMSIARRDARGDTLKKGGMMDAYFQAVAVLYGKPNIGLETADEFLAVQRSIPLNEQAARLLFELDRSPEEEYRQTQLPMENCYKLQDLPCFCTVDDMAHYSLPIDEAMIKQRNLLWMQRLPDILNKGKTFVAVGAAHLCGEAGLPALLRKAGFRVVGLPYK